MSTQNWRIGAVIGGLRDEVDRILQENELDSVLYGNILSCIAGRVGELVAFTPTAPRLMKIANEVAAYAVLLAEWALEAQELAARAHALQGTTKSLIGSAKYAANLDAHPAQKEVAP